jgi:hypothetical protein
MNRITNPIAEFCHLDNLANRVDLEGSKTIHECTRNNSNSEPFFVPLRVI